MLTPSERFALHGNKSARRSSELFVINPPWRWLYCVIGPSVCLVCHLKPNIYVERNEMQSNDICWNDKCITSHSKFQKHGLLPVQHACVGHADTTQLNIATLNWVQSCSITYLTIVLRWKVLAPQQSHNTKVQTCATRFSISMVR